jgi:uncharacterized protein involved in outer membrane biogenesis
MLAIGAGRHAPALELVLQTTLLGLAIAIILALVAALVGPLLIDWSSYRTAFETEASRLVGLEVRVTGLIDARLLPVPELTLHDIEIGTSSEDKVRARSLGIEFALGSLMRGEWRASQLRLVGPQMRLSLDASGRLQAPNVAVHFDPDTLVIERMNIQDGQLTLADAASGASVVLDKFWFKGEARSLLGPYNGEGAATVAGGLYPFRVAVGRYSDGRLKLHVNVDPPKRPLSIDVQGVLALGGGKPDFDGSISLTRPVAIASRGSGTLSQPWRVSGKLKVMPASALMQDFEFDYGSQERGFKLTGVADFKFGSRPRFNGVMSGRQIDVDRAFGENGEQASPGTAIGKLMQLAGGAFRPAIPIQIGIGIDQVTLGGDTVQNLRGDISTSAQGWNLDSFEFRAPGFTDVRVSGRLAIDDNRAVFTGPAKIAANNPMALVQWLEGRPNTAKGEVKPLGLRGLLTLAGDRIAVDHLTAEFDRKTVTGRFAYVFAADRHPAQLDATFQAPELDIDAALGFGNALLAGSPIERPHDITLAADIGRATIAGFAAKDASARLKVSSEGLQIDRLSVADLGGAAFSASGRIVTAPPSPQGSMRFDLDAPDMTPIVALLARYAPQTAKVLERHTQNMAPAKLHGTLTMEGATLAAEAKLAIDGNLGKTRLAFNTGIKTDLTTFAPGDLQLRGKLTADDGAALVTMLGLGQLVAVTTGPGELTLDANGPLYGNWRIKGQLNAGGLDANATGTASPLADSPSADLRTVIAHADAAPLRRGGGGALPVAFSGHVLLAGQDLSLSELKATVDGAVVHGNLGLTLSAPHQLQGDIDADRVDGASLMAAAIGTPPPPNSEGAAWRWSSKPFGTGVFGDYAGTIRLTAQHIDLLPELAARKFNATLSFGKNEFSLSDMAGDVAGGRLKGRVSFRAADGGLSTHVKLALTDADAAALLPKATQPPVTGTVAMSGEAEGAGLSPVALIGSLHGSGNLTFRDAQFSGLDPRAFAAVARAVDQGLAIDAARISDVASNALEGGQLSVRRAKGDIVIGAGQVRLYNFSADSEGAQLSLGGNLDLTDGSINGRVVLSGLSEQAGARPDIFMTLNGPVTAPRRSIDVSALTSWFTLRAVEIQAKQLREIERASPSLPSRESTPKSVPAAPASASSAQQKDETAAPPPVDVVLPPRRPSTPVARASVPAPKRDRAPVLPAPVEIGPAPNPVGPARPETSAVGPHN